MEALLGLAASDPDEAETSEAKALVRSSRCAASPRGLPPAELVSDPWFYEIDA